MPIVKTAFIVLLVVFCTSAALFCQGGAPPVPAGVKPGVITLPNSEFSLYMADEKGSAFLVESKGRKVALAPGKYTIMTVLLRKKDRSGVVWQLPSKSLKRPVLVRPGKTTEIAFGEPLSVSLRQSGREISFELRGNFKDAYTYFNIPRRRLEPPTVVITNPAGVVMERGQFKFG